MRWAPTQIAARIGNETINVSTTNVTAYPNPFRNEVRFNVVTPKSGNAVLELYDMLGRKMAIVYQGYLQAGIQKTIIYRVPAFHHVPMIYRLKINEKVMNGKLLPGETDLGY